MSGWWLAGTMVAVAAAAFGGIFFAPPVAVGAGLSLLLASVLMRMPLPTLAPTASARPRSLVEGIWVAVWLWEGMGSAVALVMRDALYLYSLFSVAVSVLLAATACVTNLTSRGPRLPGVPRAARLLLAAAGVATVSMLLAPVRPDGGLLVPFATFAAQASTAVAIVLSYKSIADRGRAFSLAIQAFALGVGVTVAALVANGALQGGRFGIEEVVHPNIVGGLCGLGTVMLLGYWKRIGTWWLVPIVGLLVFALFLSFSKTALLATVAACLVWSVLATPRRRMWRSAALCTAALAVVLLAGDRFLDYLSSYFQSTWGAATLSGRTQLWESTIRVWSERPVIGYGYRLFPDVIAALAPEIRWEVRSVAHAHNAALTTLLEMGLLGLLVLLAWVVSTGRDLFRLLRRGVLSADVTVPAMLLTFMVVRSLMEGDLAFRADVPFLLLVSLGAEPWRGVERSLAGRRHSLKGNEPSEGLRSRALDRLTNASWTTFQNRSM